MLYVDAESPKSWLGFLFESWSRRAVVQELGVFRGKNTYIRVKKRSAAMYGLYATKIIDDEEARTWQAWLRKYVTENPVDGRLLIVPYL